MTDVMRSIARPKMVTQFHVIDAGNAYDLILALNTWAEKYPSVRVIGTSIAKFDGGLVAVITYERPE